MVENKAMIERTRYKINRFNEQVASISSWANQTSSVVLAMQKSIAESVPPVMSVVGEMTKRIQTSGLFDNLRKTMQAFAEVATVRVNIPQEILSIAELSTNYVNIYRDAIESLNVFPSLPNIEIPKLEVEEEVDENELDSLLSKLDPEYIDILTGARQAFESDNPERIRHSCVSMRQLIDNVINKLSSSGTGRREKLGSILVGSSEEEVKFLDSFVNYAGDFTTYISGELHKEKLDMGHAENILFVGERILLLILKDKG